MGVLRSIAVFVAGLFAGRRSQSDEWRRDPEVAEALREHARRKALPFWMRGWKGFLKRLAFLVPFLILFGFLAAASGIIPIKASSGHFAITAWFLEFSMSRSVATHSMGIKAPPLDDMALVVKGAGHYETGCRPCHGGVSDVHPRIPQNMTPHPPRLPPAIPKWKPAELFYIAKHGVKLTGMPAFPALERDDEVWAIVAFLLRMPEMDVPEYQRLVFGEGAPDEVVRAFVAAEGPDTAAQTDTTAGAEVADTSAVDADAIERALIEPGGASISGLPTGSEPVSVTESCRRCHGEGGQGREVSAYPRLAGQRAEYMYAALFAYAQGERHSGMMEPIAAGLTAEEMREIALYYSQAGIRPDLGGDDRGVEVGVLDEAPTDTAGMTDSVRSQDPMDLQERLIAPDTWAQEASPGAPIEREDESIQASIARGRDITMHGIPEKKVPSCQDCHGPNRVRRNPFYPILSGQYAEYLLLQLELFKAGRRGGSVYAHLMRPTAEHLTREQMEDVALYYESLGGGPVTPIAPYMETLVPTKH